MEWVRGEKHPSHCAFPIELVVKEPIKKPAVSGSEPVRERHKAKEKKRQKIFMLF